jgi:vancomycin permeability regulator SanA
VPRPLAGILRISDLVIEPLLKLYEIPEHIPERADCLIGLAAGLCRNGTAGQVTEAVARRCASLYLSGLSQHIIFTGGFCAGGKTEAQVMCRIAEEMGVPRETILLEEESTRTHHHPPRVEPILRAHGASNIVVVSNHLHSRRAKAIFFEYYGERLVMHFANARSDFGPTAQLRYVSATTCLAWNMGTHLLARLRRWA